MTSVFADYAGEVTDNNQRVVVLATLIAPDVRVGQIDRDCAELKNMVAAWDVDTSHEQFELKASEILPGTGICGKLDEAKRIKVAKKLRRVIWNSGLHFAIVLIDKDGGGLRGIDRFKEFVSGITSQILTTISEEQKQSVEESLDRKLPEKRGLGTLGTMTGLLFGLTTGLIHAKNLGADARLIMDDQFVREIGVWEIIFQVQDVSLPLIGELGLFPHWPKDNQPGWHLGDRLTPVDSRTSYGVQLADFIAYTTRRINERPGSLADQLSVVNECLAINSGDYQGIYLITSYKTPRRRTYPRKIQRKR